MRELILGIIIKKGENMNKRLLNKLFILLSVVFSICIGVLFISYSVFAVDNQNSTIGYKIEIDTLDYDLAGLPNGLVGESYPVFPAKIKFNDQEVLEDVEINVYFDTNKDTFKGNYNDDLIVSISNNRFNTNFEGTYYIEYSLNVGTDTLIERVFIKVVPVSQYTENEIHISDDIVDDSYTGEYVYLPYGDYVFDKSFGVAKLTVNIKYSGNYECSDPEYIDNGMPYFIPKASGEYKVEYELSNILGENRTVKSSKTISVVDKEIPLIETPSFSKVIHKGDTVVFPDVEALQYIDGTIRYLPVSVLVNDVICENNIYKATSVGKIQVSYVAKSILDEDKKARLDFDVSVFDEKASTENIFDNYFNLTNFTNTFIDGICTFDTNSNVASADFFNKIPVELLNISIGAVGEFDDLYVNFTDSKNSRETLRLSLKPNKFAGVGIDLYVNEIFQKTIYDKGFDADVDSKLSLTYDMSNYNLYNEKNESIVQISNYLDGGKFVGFSSGDVYISFGLSNVSSESYVNLYSMASETISQATRDRKKPITYSEKGLSFMTAEIGQSVTIIKPECFDFLDDNPTVLITLKAPDDSVIYNNEVMTDDMILVPTMAGNYTIFYTYKDKANNQQKGALPVFIKIYDRYSPEVESIPEIKSEVKVNNVLELPEIVFTDNVSKELTTWIYVTYGDYQKQFIENNSFTFTETGKYVFKYGAMDGAGNMTYVEYVVMCK